jgi:hypothetical protein
VEYVRGSTVDFDDATINSISEGGGEAGNKYGTAATIYPTMYYSSDNRDAMAQYLFGTTYYVGGKPTIYDDGLNWTTHRMLTAGDQLKVNGAIFVTMPAAEQEVVVDAVAGLFERQEADVSDALALTDTTIYLTLYGKVGQAAADGWKAAIETQVGLLYADKTYADLTATEKQVVIAVADPAGLFYISLAGSAVYGEIGFRNGVAAAMYPTLAEAKAQSRYSKSYEDLDPATEAPYVNNDVYEALDSYYADDTARTAARDYIAAYYMSLGYVTSATYSTLNYVEKARVDQAVAGAIPSGSMKEGDYIDFLAVPGAVLKFVAEMSDALALDKSTLYNALYYNVSPTAAEGWEEDVSENGVHSTQAYYRWLSKETVSQSAAMATTVQLSEGEFYIKIENPNDYTIEIDKLRVYVRTTAGTSAEMVDAARQSLTNIYVPANEEVMVKVVASTNTVSVITWLVTAGKDTTTAQTLAAEVWTKIQNGTVAWTITAEVQASYGDEILNDTYTLTT